MVSTGNSLLVPIPESIFMLSKMEPIGDLLSSGFSSQGTELQFFSDSLLLQTFPPPIRGYSAYSLISRQRSRKPVGHRLSAFALILFTSSRLSVSSICPSTKHRKSLFLLAR